MARLALRDRRREVLRLTWIVLVLAVGTVLLLLPVELPYRVATQGHILPAREWMIMRDTGGSLTSNLFDHTHGMTSDFSVAQFDREDAMRFRLRRSVLASQFIHEGDTVGEAESTLIASQLAELRGDLLTERATLELNSAGEKASVVAEARHRVTRAEEQVAAQFRIVERLRELTRSNAASVEDLEIAESRLDLYETEVEIARAALQTVSTGAKVEQVAMIRAQIASLEDQIAALDQRLRSYTVTSPISGLIFASGSPDTLMLVADTSSFVVLMPIPWSEREFVKPGQNVLFAVRSGDGTERGHILRLEPVARRIGGRAVIIAAALLDPDDDADLMPGMSARCTIESGSVRPLEYTRRYISRLLSPG